MPNGLMHEFSPSLKIESVFRPTVVCGNFSHTIIVPFYSMYYGANTQISFGLLFLLIILEFVFKSICSIVILNIAV